MNATYGMSESISKAWADKAIGEIGEGMMRSYFRYTGWEQIKVPTQNYINGLDGVFVKRTSSGTIKDVSVVESKVNTSQEGFLKTGECQGSKAYNLKKINEGISLTTNLSQKKDLLQIRDFIEKDIAKSIEHRVRFHREGRVEIIHRSLTSPKGNINLIQKGPPRTVANFNYSNPQNTYEKFMSKSVRDEAFNFFSNSNKNLSKANIDNILTRLGLKGELRNNIYESLREIPDIRNLPRGFDLRSPQIKVLGRTSTTASIDRVEQTISTKRSVLQNSIKNASIAGGLVFLFETGLATYDYVSSDISTGELYDRMKKGSVDGVVVASSSSTIKPILSAVLPDGRLLCATEAGIFVVAIEMGLASVELWNGEIDVKEFKRRATESIVKGTAVGGVTYMALYLGATPGGLVVLALGTGAYIITDLGIKEYRRQQWIHQTNNEELARFGIVNINNPTIIENPNNPITIENPDNPLNVKNEDNLL